MSLDPSPKPVLWQDVAVGDRVYLSPESDEWYERGRFVGAEEDIYNAKRYDGKYVNLYPLTKVWRK